eukprot:scaffold5705_cov140-Skeletonema_dohrnii-CCMP3373.AAC.1
MSLRMVYCHSCNVTCFSNRCQSTVAPRFRMIVDKTWLVNSQQRPSGRHQACPSRGLVCYEDARQWVRRCVQVEDSSVIDQDARRWIVKSESSGLPGRKALDHQIPIRS